jgi:trehalose utilization protein
MSIKVTVWNEFVHEKHNERVKEVYPDGIHNAIAEYLKTQEDMIVRTDRRTERKKKGEQNRILQRYLVLAEDLLFRYLLRRFSAFHRSG